MDINCSRCVVRPYCSGKGEGECDLMRSVKANRSAKFWRAVREAVTNTLLTLAVAALLIWGVGLVARWGHQRTCTYPTTGRCGWAWCEHYDGSDALHDFNF